MSDWSIVAAAEITAAAGIAGAGLGYLTAWKQSGTEIARLRLEHGEERLRHRQAVYHDFLDSAHRFHQDAGGVEAFVRSEEYQAWARAFEHNLTAVSLFGTEEAWKAAQNLADRVEEAMDAAPHPDVYSAQYEPAFLDAWKATVRAMRPDTAP